MSETMPFEGNRAWAFLGLGAAAAFAVGSLVAVSVVGDQQRVASQAAGASSSELQQRYSVAVSAIHAWESTNLEARCEAENRAVSAVDLEARMATALESASVVRDAYLIINPEPRETFEQQRIETVDAFEAEFTTPEDEAVAQGYEGVDDIVAACLEQPAPTTGLPSVALTLDAVEEIEARATELGDAAVDVSRFDAIEQTVASFGAAVLAAADARVPVSGLSTTDGALAAVTGQLRAEQGPEQTLLVLEALISHSEASLEVQAAIEARQQEQQEQQQAPVNPAPRPQLPPLPQPEPPPAPEPPPEPTGPGNGEGDSGDAIIEPRVP